jgi:hypothetical protein
MKTEKFQLRGNNSVCAGAFQLMRGRVPKQLKCKIATKDACIMVLTEW